VPFSGGGRFDIIGTYFLNAAPQAIPNDTLTDIEWEADSDPYDLLAANGDTFLTMPEGEFVIHLGVDWAAGVTGYRLLTDNDVFGSFGATVWPGTAIAFSLPWTFFRSFTASEVWRPRVRHTQGAPLNITGATLRIGR
jgi:hypothetical protein